MKKRNQWLIVVFLILLVVNIGLLLLGGKTSSISFEEDLFVLRDTTTVETIRIQKSDSEIFISRSDKGWEINNQYQVDEGLRRLFFSIMQRVQVKKLVNQEIPEEVATILISGEIPLSFQAWGNPNRTHTYFSLNKSEEVYEVIIPGYNEYLGQIFDLKSDQWRDRLLIDASWRTIQELALNYGGSEEKDFSIRFDESFFKVDQVQAIDSNAVVDYLNQFQYFEVNEWISSGRFDRYDSLSKMPPYATLSIFSINMSEPLELNIFPNLTGEPFHLAMDIEGNMMVIDRKRMLGILRKRSDFKVED